LATLKVRQTKLKHNQKQQPNQKQNPKHKQKRLTLTQKIFSTPTLTEPTPIRDDYVVFWNILLEETSLLDIVDFLIS